MYSKRSRGSVRMIGAITSLDFGEDFALYLLSAHQSDASAIVIPPEGGSRPPSRFQSQYEDYGREDHHGGSGSQITARIEIPFSMPFRHHCVVVLTLKQLSGETVLQEMILALLDFRLDLTLDGPALFRMCSSCLVSCRLSEQHGTSYVPREYMG